MPFCTMYDYSRLLILFYSPQSPYSEWSLPYIGPLELIVSEKWNITQRSGRPHFNVRFLELFNKR